MQRYWNQVFLGIAVTAAVMIGVVLLSNVRDLADKLGSFPLWLFGPVIALKFVNWVLRYFEWHYFLHVINVYPVVQGETRPALSTDEPATIRVTDSFILWMASLPFSLSPGKMAEVLKALILKSMTGTLVMRSTPIIFAERLIDGIAVVVIVGASALLAPEAIFATDDISSTTIQLVLIGISIYMVGVIIVAQQKPIVYFFLDIAARLPIIRRFDKQLRMLYESSYDLTKPRHIFRTTFMGVGAYFSDCIGFYIILLGLGEAPSTTLFLRATFILGFSVVISALSAMPGGAGGRELTVSLMLSSIVGMEAAATAAAVLIVGIFQVWFGAFLGIIIGLIFRKRLFPEGLLDEIESYEQRHSEASVSPASP